MSSLPTPKIIATFVLLFFACLKTYGQQGEVTILQDKKVNQLLNERAKLLKNGELKNYYTIQVISGEIETARETLAECKEKFTDYKSDIVYQTPHYKVWVGRYRNRLDADAALTLITEEYPGAFVFRPENKKPQKKPTNN
ncbi:MAG: SPOR domain-containing protein [Flavobacteriaceae bacterium]